MMEIKTTINEYLFYEFGEEGDENAISDSFPFELNYLGSIDDHKIFEFADGRVEYFALAGKILNFYPKDGMNFENLSLQILGAEWITNREPLDLDTSRIGYASIPSTLERATAIEQLVDDAFGKNSNTKVLNGFYLCSTGKYIALVQQIFALDATIIGDDFEPHKVNYNEASSWRRLAVGVGEMVISKKLTS